MSQPTIDSRKAISRAEFFLSCAKDCGIDKRNEHEAYLEAAIVFGRSELNRLNKKCNRKCKPWWKSQLADESVKFLVNERNQILKENPPKIGQRAYVGHTPPHVSCCYYYEKPSIPAMQTIERHIKRIKEISLEAHRRLSANENDAHPNDGAKDLPSSTQ